MGQTRPSEDEYLTIPEVCEITGLGRFKVKEFLASGELPSFKYDEGRTSPRYIARSELDAFLAKKREEGRAAVRPARGRRTAARPTPKTSAAAS
jgi:excisionase family DNA binding protein